MIACLSASTSPFFSPTPTPILVRTSCGSLFPLTTATGPRWAGSKLRRHLSPLHSMDLVPEGQAVEASGPGMVHKREAGRGRGDELIPSFSQTALIVKPQTLSKWPQVCARQFRWDTSQERQEADLVSVERPSSPLAWPGPMVFLPSPTFLLLSGETSPLSGPRKARKFSEVS